MHEIGHTLGLRHGGGDHVGYKPNYHSVMNYTWQLRGSRDAATAMGQQLYESSWYLDYSRRAFGSLDEKNLVDLDGIGGSIFRFVPAGLLQECFGTLECARVVLEGGAVDCNHNGCGRNRGLLGAARRRRHQRPSRRVTSGSVTRRASRRTGSW